MAGHGLAPLPQPELAAHAILMGGPPDEDADLLGDEDLWACRNCTTLNTGGTACTFCGSVRAPESGPLTVYTGGSSAQGPAPGPRVTCVSYDERMLLHQERVPADDRDVHPERPDRLHAVWSHLADVGLTPLLQRVPSVPITAVQVQRVHTAAHWDEVIACATRPATRFGPDTYAVPGSVEAARVAAGAVVEVMRHVVSGHAANGLAVVRPPGHHAEPGGAMGFCLLNNVAVAARAAQAEMGVSRVLILDWDVHHGNGTQTAFQSDPSVLYVSLHRFDDGDFFPGTGAPFDTGEGAGAGCTLNVGWPHAHMGDAEYLAAFQQLVMPVAHEFAPELVLVSAGFDAAQGDPLGGCCLSPAGYAHITHMLLSLAAGRVVLALEGGYNLYAMSQSVEACARVLVGQPPPPLAHAARRALPGALRAIRTTMAYHRRHWASVREVSEPLVRATRKAKATRRGYLAGHMHAHTQPQAPPHMQPQQQQQQHQPHVHAHTQPQQQPPMYAQPAQQRQPHMHEQPMQLPHLPSHHEIYDDPSPHGPLDAAAAAEAPSAAMHGPLSPGGVHGAGVLSPRRAGVGGDGLMSPARRIGRAGSCDSDSVLDSPTRPRPSVTHSAEREGSQLLWHADLPSHGPHAAPAEAEAGLGLPAGDEGAAHTAAAAAHTGGMGLSAAPAFHGGSAQSHPPPEPAPAPAPAPAPTSAAPSHRGVATGVETSGGMEHRILDLATAHLREGAAAQPAWQSGGAPPEMPATAEAVSAGQRSFAREGKPSAPPVQHAAPAHAARSCTSPPLHTIPRSSARSLLHCRTQNVRTAAEGGAWMEVVASSPRGSDHRLRGAGRKGHEHPREGRAGAAARGREEEGEPEEKGVGGTVVKQDNGSGSGHYGEEEEGAGDEREEEEEEEEGEDSDDAQRKEAERAVMSKSRPTSLRPPHQSPAHGLRPGEQPSIAYESPGAGVGAGEGHDLGRAPERKRARLSTGEEGGSL